MNLMRKLRGATSSSSADSAEASSSSSHIQLGLMHLKKLFAEYTHPPQPLTDAEKDDKLYNMLPLFCKVFIHKETTNCSVLVQLQTENIKLTRNNHELAQVPSEYCKLYLAHLQQFLQWLIFLSYLNEIPSHVPQHFITHASLRYSYLYINPPA